jgi:hypothetical protein
MVAAAIGGAVLFVSILLFVYVAVGTRLQNTLADPAPQLRFADVDPNAMPTAPIFDRLGGWAVAAISLAIVAYAGPIAQQLSQHHYLAPGMRTW